MNTKWSYCSLRPSTSNQIWISRSSLKTL